LVLTVSAASDVLFFALHVISKDIEVVGINDLLDANYMAYMLKYDTVHGRSTAPSK
jgi:glyceraldehyde-3-phosphate dehydrogenase/erythrose-4-phosphate dehydrogenase